MGEVASGLVRLDPCDAKSSRDFNEYDSALEMGSGVLRIQTSAVTLSKPVYCLALLDSRGRERWRRVAPLASSTDVGTDDITEVPRVPAVVIGSDVVIAAGRRVQLING